MIRYERDAAGALFALAQVEVGTERPVFRVALGSWNRPEPDPGGLMATPVVVLAGAAWAEVVIGAAARSGDAETRDVIPIGPALLTAAACTDLLLVRDGNGRAMNVIRALGGRPLPALPLSDPEAIRELLDGCHVDLDIAIPAVEEPRRAKIRSSLAPLRLEDLHHLVEVDPRPGLDTVGLALRDAPLDALGAAAAGVLAGRLAAGSRRWRADRS